MTTRDALLPVHPLQYEPLLRRALEEDLGVAGDLTTNAVVPAEERLAGRIVARRTGCIAGLEVAARTFALLDSEVHVKARVADGDVVAADSTLAEIAGPARAILTGERVALNLLGHLSGVATVTRGIVDAIGGTRARVVCTRKTTPGLRALEKYAVRCGGGSNHRFGLNDAVLIKDNHLALAGSVEEAVRRARAAVGHLVKVEVEVDDLDQLQRALACPIDAVLLDNMPPPVLRQAVELVAARVITEASGGITPETARAIAETGVDLLSVGWITHSAPSLDVALDV
ncbi:MAG TPA: carboxylating nicotinate-nucleotide diphosphorylase [Thermoanaerobaculia bacterium]|jgi:nicotinate-nucleotide pyrophosphorylase (carboxylating)|nr:carboxylating nicotinate-nucleotide diphosphorylase [Thermoanaerobaculia bacterium]